MARLATAAVRQWLPVRNAGTAGTRLAGPHSMSVRASLLASFLLVLFACGDEDAVTGPCTANYVAGLSITVTDAVTGAPVEGVTAEIRDGSWVDPYVTVSGHTVMGAGERPGVYTITIRKDGYLDWTRSGVRVTMTSDRCHVRPVRLEAALIPKK
jgi:hypothetical protein